MHTSLAQDLHALEDTVAADEARLACRRACAEGAGADSLVGLGRAAGLPFHTVLALLLKREWQHLLDRTLGGDPKLAADETGVDLRLLEKRFAPDHAVLFDVLAAGAYVPNGAAYDVASLRDTVREMVLLDLHLLPLDSAEQQAFAQRALRADALRQAAPADLEQAYGAARHEWLLLQEELGERLLCLERCRLDHENALQRWLAVFGAASIELDEQAARLEAAQRRIDLKLAQPRLERLELERIAAAIDAEGQARRDRLRQRAAVASVEWCAPAVATAMTPEDVSEYRRKSKRALQEIWMLLHPDRLARRPEYAQLTAQQKERLDALWQRAMAVRDEEFGCAPGYLGHDHRSLVVLLDIVEMVRAILGNAGIDTDASLIIQGESLAERVAWLERSIDRLLGALDGVQAELVALLNDPEHRRRNAMTDAPAAKQQQMQQQMQQRAGELATKVRGAQAYLDALFQPAALPANRFADAHEGEPR